jgi:hypothetical protein
MRILSTCLVCSNDKHRLLYPSTYRGTLQEAHRYFLAQREARETLNNAASSIATSARRADFHDAAKSA